jgi:hypothetical protein
MKLKKQEFLALKQGAMSVSEYRDKFIQLSRYAPADVADDAEKQDHFRDGLIGPIKYQLMVHTFENSQKMVDNASMVELAVAPSFKDKTECITICIPESSSIHIVTSSVNN